MHWFFTDRLTSGEALSVGTETDLIVNDNFIL
jgi:hypothetical protein